MIVLFDKRVGLLVILGFIEFRDALGALGETNVVLRYFSRFNFIETKKSTLVAGLGTDHKSMVLVPHFGPRLYREGVLHTMIMYTKFHPIPSSISSSTIIHKMDRTA